MDRYQKVEKPRPESAAISENEIRITSQGLIRNYLNYASSLLQERNLKVIVLKAMGQAISKAVAVTEIIKKWNPHLHQDVSISSVSITDVWEPIEEGLVPLETKRLVSVIAITLSIVEPKKKTPGYQAPAQVEQPKRQQKFQQLQQPQQPQQHRQTLDSYGRERNRGSGRGRGWARGGYGGYNNNQGGYYGYRNNHGGYNGGGYNGFSYNQGGYGGYRSNQENGGWNANWSRGDGPGRGWNSRGSGPVYGGGYGGGPGGGGRNGNGGGGRGYVRGRGRVGGRGRGGY